MALVGAGARRMRGSVHRLQDIVYYAGEYALIGFVGSQGPRRLMRLVFRIPVGVYQVGLGAAVGHNVLVLETTGRKSGRPHLTAMRYEYDASDDTYYVLSGWRGHTDWYRNVRGNNRVNVRVGRRRFTTHAELLGADESVAILSVYVSRNPLAAATIRKETGLACDGSVASLRAVANYYPAVALRPSP